MPCASRSHARLSGPPRRPRRRPIRIPARSAAMSTPMPERNLVQAVRDALDEEMARDERVCVLGEDVGLKGGVFKATGGFNKRTGGNRGLDTPLAGSGMPAVARGPS